MNKVAEFVSPKHPDKICDQISDAILDECLNQDPDSRVAVETMGGHGIVTITGELTTNAQIDFPDIVHMFVPGIGVQVNLVKQSNEIGRGVDNGGAGDQGIMVGYACRENREMMPTEYVLARSLCRFIYDKHPYDGKTQVVINGNLKPVNILASFQNVPAKTIKKLINEWLKRNKLKCKEILANTAGDWEQGGFDADTGVTGRKIVMDAYGPRVPVGGGAFSGKDPSKVDRSAAYMARAIAVDTLKKSKQVKEVMVRVAYAIGKECPLCVEVFADGMEFSDEGLYHALIPKNIIETLGLKKPIYLKTAQWGHFGNNFNWDK
jgi:S-adenosylmethionine synthetase